MGHQKRLQLYHSTAAANGVPKQHRRRHVVFLCDSAAHHSLILPFRELFAAQTKDASLSFRLVELRIEPSRARFDLGHLKEELERCRLLEQADPMTEVLPVAVLTAGSNVTGLLNPFEETNVLIHGYGGLCCWDFAGAMGHAAIDFNPSTNYAGRIDVGFFSPHKLLGGPGASGFLVIKKALMGNDVPSSPGGGVVFFVSNEGHSYIHNAEEREEGGTPNVVGDIRAGLVYRLYASLPITSITSREHSMVAYVMRHWSMHKKIDILGPAAIQSDLPLVDQRTAVVAFLVRYSPSWEDSSVDGSQWSGLYLHHQFVVALLNDLFGIQTRGGCACAGPLSQYLLGLPDEQTRAFERALEKTGQEILRPGFVRASLHFSMSWDDVEAVTQSVLWVADLGWRFLPAYTFVPETGEWVHRNFSFQNTRNWLSTLSILPAASPAVPSIDAPVEAESSRPGKNPKQLVGAVSVLGGQTDGQQLKAHLKKALAGLKKPSESKLPPPPTAAPMSELEEAWKRRAISTASGAGDGKADPKEDAAASRFPRSSPPASQRGTAGIRPSIGSRSQDLSKFGAFIKKPSIPFLRQSTALATTPEPKPSHPSQSDVSETVSRSVEPLDGDEVPSEGKAAPVRQASFTALGDVADPPAPRSVAPAHVPDYFDALMAANHAIVTSLYDTPQSSTYLKTASGLPGFPEEYRHLVWFPLPADAAAVMTAGSSATLTSRVPPFVVRRFDGCEAARPHPLCGESSEELPGVPTYVPTDDSDVPAKEDDPPPQRDAKGYLKIPRHLRHRVGSAIREFSMIREGDRLLVGLSGGKDSLTLLHVLRDAQRRSPVKFELSAATVDPQTPEYCPQPLVPYLKTLGIPYHMLSYPIIELAKTHMQKESICAFCSRMKRGLLYSCMPQHNYNVLVLGQHLDDICESFLMSAFHNGSLNTMKAHYVIGKGDVRVCRPLIFVREKELAAFANATKLPVISDNCPACFAQPKERHRTKILLAQQEFEHPHIFQNLLQAVKPLIAISTVEEGRSTASSPAPADEAAFAEEMLVASSAQSHAENADFQAEQVLTVCGIGKRDCCNV